MRSQSTIYRVSFFEKDKKDPIELEVKSVESSEFPGLVCFSDIILPPVGAIILPDEEKTVRKFKNTKSIHVPFHNILYIEEMTKNTGPEENISFIKEVKPEP